ncbi:MAG TPA: winged helix-turn-helix domain-containing protein, partial [Polyangia bacterium]|nr:winged helix-turn-helix domain-containing protein [Polyangia bacterium]
MSSVDKGASQRHAISFGPFSLYARERRLERDGRIVKLGSRALEILMILTARAGDVISKEELTSLVWPDIAVEESGLRVHVAALRKALGDGRQGARYVANVPGRGYSFVAPVEGIASVSMAAPSTPARGRDLPSRLEWIVGRDATIREVAEQLAARRFVNVVGPGGMGKTTVAIAVAHSLLDEFRDDVCFVDLGAVNSPAQVGTSIASSLGMGPVAGDVVQGLVGFLSGRRMLLVLDSCEHVVDALAPLAERLVSRAGTLHLLATSREPLRVQGEHVHRMAPLEVPPEQTDGVTASTALTFSAVKLFVERAQAGGARFSVTDEDARVI